MAALFAVALDDEECVVDADRKADHDDDVHYDVGQRVDLAENRAEPHRDNDGGQRNQQRYTGGNQRAEDDDQDDERDRQAEHLGLGEVLFGDLAVDFAAAQVADRQDVNSLATLGFQRVHIERCRTR